MTRKHGDALTAEQVAAFIAYCRHDFAEATPDQRAKAIAVVIARVHQPAIPARWLPDILYARGFPPMAKAIDDILTYGEVMPL